MVMRESNMGPLGMWGESPHIYHLFVKQQYSKTKNNVNVTKRIWKKAQRFKGIYITRSLSLKWETYWEIYDYNFIQKLVFWYKTIKKKYLIYAHKRHLQSFRWF